MNSQISSYGRDNLQTLVTQDGLRINIIMTGENHIEKKWSGLISSIKNQQKLSQYFETFQQVANYLCEKENIRLNIQQKTIKIVAKVNISLNKVKQIELAQVPLVLVQEGIKQQAQKIMQRCRKQHYLSENEVKLMIGKLSGIIYELINSKTQQIEENKAQKQINQQIYKQQYTKISNFFEQKSLKTNQQFSQLKNQINSIKQNVVKELNQIIKVKQQNFEKKFQQASQQLHKAINLTLDFDTSMEDKLNKKLKQITANFTHHEQTQTVIKKLTHLGENVQKLMQRISHIQNSQTKTQYNAQKFVDAQCYDYNNLKFQQNNIIAQYTSYVFGKNSIRSGTQFTIIPKKIKNVIAIGIVDSQYRQMSDLDGVTNLFIYCSNGSYYNGREENNNYLRYASDDNVTVSVDFVAGWVEWRVGSVLTLKIQANVLKDNTINWVPYIYLNDKRDCVSI